MMRSELPPRAEMYRALLERDAGFEGVFVVAVRTTGIFCRPTCPARKPKEANVEFFHTTAEALGSGYRPCKRCRPMEREGAPPAWLRGLLDEIEREPGRRWRDADLRARSVDPVRVRRWFKAQHGMTFHAYLRARRLGAAMGRIREGSDLAAEAYDAGYESPSGFREAFGRWFEEPPGSARASELVLLKRVLTPLGPLLAGATADAVCLLEFADRPMLETQIRRLTRRLDAKLAPGSNAVLDGLAGELEEYFAGDRRTFTVPLRAPGSEFQEGVWRELRSIPYGHTLSYGELARRLGRRGAERAVGRANGDNRIAILIPCHRVVRSDGTLCGYGGGVWRKRALLELEGARLAAAGAAGPAPQLARKR